MTVLGVCLINSLVFLNSPACKKTGCVNKKSVCNWTNFRETGSSRILKKFSSFPFIDKVSTWGSAKEDTRHGSGFYLHSTKMQLGFQTCV